MFEFMWGRGHLSTCDGNFVIVISAYSYDKCFLVVILTTAVENLKRIGMSVSSSFKAGDY